MKFPIAIIMTPGRKQRFVIVQEKSQPKRRWIVIQVQGVAFQKRAVLIGNESLQLGMLLTALDSKRNCACNAGAHRFLQKSRSQLKILGARQVT